jgi:hypothetical protein
LLAVLIAVKRARTDARALFVEYAFSCGADRRVAKAAGSDCYADSHRL